MSAKMRSRATFLLAIAITGLQAEEAGQSHELAPWQKQIRAD